MVNYPIDYELDEFCYIHLYIADITKAKEFYTDIFGFSTIFDEGEDGGWIELELPIKGVKIRLSLNPEVKIEDCRLFNSPTINYRFFHQINIFISNCYSSIFL
jgi:hypothetical protein